MRQKSGWGRRYKMSDKTSNLLEVKNLKTGFEKKNGMLVAIEKINISLEKGKILGIVGESGSGKTQLAFSLMKLLRKPGKIMEGSIEFQGVELLGLSDEQMRKKRGYDVSMIFQDPMAALDPVYTVGQQMTEALGVHKKMQKQDAYEKCVRMLENVGIIDPKQCMRSYPFELSGGMCQRVMIAMALLGKPDLLIADEPTTALDVTIQAQILDLIRKQCARRDMSVVLITHDLAVVSEVTDYIAVMYLGEILEYGTTEEIIKNPLHPYTQGLLKSMPKIEMAGQPLFMIEGNIPELAAIKRDRCRFYDRCPYAGEACIGDQYDDEVYGTDHRVRCVKYK